MGRSRWKESCTNGVRATEDVDALATKGEREAAVLLWNYHDAAEPAPGAAATVAIRGLPASVSRVLVTHYRIDETHSNAYTVWKGMGSPQTPTAEQYAELQSRDGLELLGSPVWTDAVGGTIAVRTEMPRESVSLLIVRW